jgi:hypothetical protein
MMAPFRIDSTLSSILLGWNPPNSDGGCPILGYAVFRDDGSNSAATIEVNIPNDPAVRDI